MKLISASELIENNYRDFGKYVNTTRAIPGIDGLKLVQRRVLLAVRDVATSGWTKSSLVIGRTMAYHAHGDSSIYGTLVRLVNNGFVLGHGNFGRQLLELLPHAASRYTSVMCHKKFQESVFKLTPFNPVMRDGDEVEPAYLSVPLPLCICTGSMGIGVGLAMRVPIFDAKSIADAMLRDDPSLLRAPTGSYILDGDIDKLWQVGIGWIQYGINCYKETIPEDGRVTVIDGSTKVLVPDLYNGLKDWMNDELVYLRDESGSDLRVVIGRVKNVRKITDDDIHNKCVKLCKKTMYYTLYVSYNGVAHRVSMRDWLNATWTKFSESLIAWKSFSLREISNKINMYNLIPPASKLIIAGKGTEEIASELNQSVVMIKEIESLPIRTIRKNDFSERVAALERDRENINRTTDRGLLKIFLESLYN